jgi:hypothetical protein
MEKGIEREGSYIHLDLDTSVTMKQQDRNRLMIEQVGQV